MRVATGSRGAALFVGRGGVPNIIPATGFMVATMTLHDDEERFIVKQSGAPNLLPSSLHANRPTGSTAANHVRGARHLHRGLAFSPSFTWWERHCLAHEERGLMHLNCRRSRSVAPL